VRLSFTFHGYRVRQKDGHAALREFSLPLIKLFPGVSPVIIQNSGESRPGGLLYLVNDLFISSFFILFYFIGERSLAGCMVEFMTVT